MIKNTTLQDILELPPADLKISTAAGGHMAYNHLIIEAPHDKLFVKSYDPSQFTSDLHRQHSLDYLTKEYLYFKYLKTKKYNNIPKRFELINDQILAMDALLIENGWHWRIPKNKNDANQYASDILLALDHLGKIKTPDITLKVDIRSTYEILVNEGWQDIDDQKMKLIKNKIKSCSKKLATDFNINTNDFISNLESLQSVALDTIYNGDFYFSHNDARHSNIAWHPKLGVKVVDWSWAGNAPKNGDSTMFIIDLAKSGHNVKQHLKSHFNYGFALTLIGYWLSHSIVDEHNKKSNVRLHQIASAISAYQLINTAVLDLN